MAYMILALCLLARLSLCFSSVLWLNSSEEFQLRKFLFKTQPFDKNVRPVVKINEPLQVNFTLSLIKLNNVDIKEQCMDVDLWVTMKWNNPYLRWKPETFGGINRIQVSAESIWTPDIVLINNVNTDNPFAGGPKMFINPVMLHDNGLNIWYSPANFKANCQIDISSWPFDNQTCSLLFGSISKGGKELEMFPTDNDDIANGNVGNGEWRLTHRISVEKISRRQGCCTFEYSQCLFTLKISRKTSYHCVYLVLPCTVLVFLTLVSFAIPSESGERIGFCITILLAMAVYLLLVAQSVPETSDQVPVLGKFFIASFIEIFTALVSTIVVLRVYHNPGKPGPKWQTVFGSTVFCVKREKQSKISATPSVVKTKPVENIAEVTEYADEEEMVGSDESVKPPETNVEDAMLTWQDVSESLNQKLLYVVLILSIIICAIVVPAVAKRV